VVHSRSIQDRMCSLYKNEKKEGEEERREP
jgi:hypothetical protein